MRNLLFLLLTVAGWQLHATAAPGLRLEATTFSTINGVEVAAERGELEVPACRSCGAAGELTIQFVWLKSTAADPIEPTIYLEGGPGASCSWQAENPHALENWLPLLELGDLILLDQRGTGAASEQMTWIIDDPLPGDVWVSQEAANRHIMDMAMKAIPAWAASGVQLEAYTSLESAGDIEALREALDLPKINLLGFSYGTHLGQVYMKYYADRVAHAILCGVEGLNETFKEPARMDAAFHRLSRMVAADPELNADVPDLVALYQRVSNGLAESPITLEMDDPLNGGTFPVKVGKFALDYILFCDLGDASDLPVFPRLLYTMDQGDYSVFRWFLAKRFNRVYGLHAMAVTMDLVSGGSPERLAMIQTQASKSLFGNVVNPGLILLDKWPVADLGPVFRADFHCDVPTLLLSGTLDFNTPPYQAERLRWNLPNAQHLIVQNAGHEQVLPHPKVQAAILAFLQGEDISEQTAGYPPLRFIPVRGERQELWHPSLETSR
ncbi:MAG: alpha/beta hydrolase [Bacteroidota bacterium]